MRKNVLFIGLLMVLASFIWAGGAQEVTPQESDDGYKYITTEDLEFRWMIEGENLKVEVTAPTTGWVSVGFDATRAMKDGDFIIGFVKDGSLTISDQYGTGAFTHKPDVDIGGTRDIVSASGTESDGSTTLEFVIPLDSGDEYDAELKPDSQHTVLFAYGPDGADDLSTKHAFRAKVTLQL